MRRYGTAAIAAGVLVLGSCSDDPGDDAVEVLLRLDDAHPSEIIGLRAAGPATIEWIDRIDGEIRSLDVDAGGDPAIVATVPIAADGEQWGLLGATVVGDRRFAVWTRADPAAADGAELVVGELVDGVPGPDVFDAGSASELGIGGPLRAFDDRLLVGLGQEVGWAEENETRGVLALLDPAAPAALQPEVLSSGYTNP